MFQSIIQPILETIDVILFTIVVMASGIVASGVLIMLFAKAKEKRWKHK